MTIKGIAVCSAFLFILAFLVLFSGISFSEEYQLPVNELQLKTPEIHNQVYEVNFSAEDLSFSQLQGYDVVRLTDGIFTHDVGKPELPCNVLHIAIPAGEDVARIEIIEDVTEEIPGQYNIYPAQESVIIGQEREFTLSDPGVYNSAQRFPAKVVEQSAQGSLMGMDVASVCIYPLQYIPAEQKLILHTRLKFKLKFIPEKSDKARLKTKIKHSKRTKLGKAIVKEVAKKVLANSEESVNVCFESSVENQLPVPPKPIPGPEPIPPEPVDYLIITSQELIASGVFQPLLEKRQQQGYATRITSVSWIGTNCAGEDTQEKIRNYIKDLYTNNGLIYVLLGGDGGDAPGDDCANVIIPVNGTGIIPVRYTAPIPADSGAEPSTLIPVACDMYYSCLDGNWDADGDNTYGEVEDNVDLYPDVFVGRAAVDNSEEAAIFVAKTLAFGGKSCLDYTDKAALFIALEEKDLSSGATIWSGAAIKDSIDEDYMPNIYKPITKLYQRDGTENRANVLSALDQGHYLVNHIDHGNINRLKTGNDGFYSDDVDSLTNGSPENNQCFSLFYSIGCWPAAIDFDCIAEHWITSPEGGGPVFIGNSRGGTHPQSTECLDVEFYKQLFDEGFYHVGETLAFSKVTFINDTGFDPDSHYDDYMRLSMHGLNLLGDPALTISSLSPLKEISYYPRDYPWVYFWPNWDSGSREQMDEDLDRIVALNANTVRIFIQPHEVGYPVPDAQFLLNFEEALALIDAHGLKAHVTLFDFDDFYPHPPEEEIPIGDVISDSETWLDAIVIPHQNDPRIAVWELHNEIVLHHPDPAHPAAEHLRLRVKNWIQSLFPYLKQRTGNTPCTISINQAEWFQDIKTYLKFTPLDIYSFHWGAKSGILWSREFPDTIDQVRAVIGEDARLLLGEFGCNTWEYSEVTQADFYRDILYYANQKGIIDIGAWTLNDFPEDLNLPGVGDVIDVAPGELFNGIYRYDETPKPVATVLKEAFGGNPLSNLFLSTLYNSSFEEVNSHGEFVNWSFKENPNTRLEQDTTVSYSGQASAKLSGEVSGEVVGFLHLPGLVVKPGESYCAYAYIRTQMLNGGAAKFVLYWFDEQGNFITHNDSQIIADSNLEWRMITCNTNAPANARYVTIYPQMYVADTAARVWFDDINFRPITDLTIKVINNEYPNSPVEEAKIDLYLDEQKSNLVLSGYTDAQGEFSFSSGSPLYCVISKYHYETEEYWLNSNHNSETVFLQRQNAGVCVHGYDNEGDTQYWYDQGPVRANVKIFKEYYYRGSWYKECIYNRYSDPLNDGKCLFYLEDIPDVSYSYKVSKRGYVTEEGPIWPDNYPEVPLYRSSGKTGGEGLPIPTIDGEEPGGKIIPAPPPF